MEYKGFWITTHRGSTQGGPWHVASKPKGRNWYIVNVKTGSSKKIGPISAKVNYFDRAVSEAQRRNNASK